MGGRGSSSGKGGKSSSNGAPALDRELIRRANDAGTFVDYGDATNRQYNKNVDEISTMDLTAAEKDAAYKELHNLTQKQLEAESKARGAYAPGVGPARFNSRAIQQNQSKALSARNEVQSFMDGLRKGQQAKARQREQKALTEAYNKALAEGALSFTVNGKTWMRKTRRSKTFTSN